MSIQSEINRIAGNVADALDAIEDKGVTVPSGSNSDDLADLISQITGGGGGSAISVVDTLDSHGGTIRTITSVDLSGDTVTAPHLEQGYTAHDAQGNLVTGTLSPGGGGGGGDWNDPIRFFDYDGTLIASYKSIPSALPAVPTHTGLKNGTWNYTLQQVTTQFNAMGTCDVGANYMTQSEDTEIDVVMQEGRLSPTMTISVNGTVTVDWGDNTTADTVTGNSLKNRLDVPHMYASAGSYTIKVHAVSGEFSFWSTSSYPILRKATSNNESLTYTNCIRAVRIGAGMPKLDDYAFGYCYSLVSISIPNTVASVGTNTFLQCYSLVSISIPSGVTSIGNYVFQYCYSLISVSLPSGLTTLGDSLYSYCYSLPSISIPSGTTAIPQSMFAYCYSLAEVRLPSVVSIGNFAFQDCRSLSSVNIPSGVTSIGNSVFSYCHALAAISIPSAVTSIDNYAFRYCHALAVVRIPSGVTSIGNGAFQYCYGVAEYHLSPTTPPTLGTSVFQNLPSDCKIYVPSASLTAYQTAENWSTYASYMVGE